MSILYDPDRSRGTRGPATLPLVGTIAAGQPIEAVEDREDVQVDELIPHGDDYYLLKVRGKSMVEDHIDDGDLVVVERRQTASNGDIVVAILENEEATLKRFYREKGTIRLQPANSSLDPIYPKKVEIRGVVRGVVRSFR